MVVCSYPLSSVGIVQSANELGFKPKMIGGAMVGLQATGVQGQAQVEAQRHRQLRDLGAVAEADGAGRRRSSRNTRSAPRPRASIRSAIISAAGAMPISRCSARRSPAPSSVDDDKLAEYLRSHEFKTIMGDIRFGKNGEWTKSGMLQVQYHGITDAANLETWRGMSYQTVISPADQKTGDMVYPYEKAAE